MQKQSTFGDWANSETFLVYMWISINDGGRRILEEVRDYPGSIEDRAEELWWKLDKALSSSTLSKRKKPEHDLFINLLIVSLSQVNFEQLIRKA